MATRPPKRPVPILKDPSTPQNIFTPKSLQSGNGGTPTNLHQTDDSPERSAKRARFDAGLPALEQNGNAPRLGQLGRTMSGGRGGAVWVHAKISELEGMYKVSPCNVQSNRSGMYLGCDLATAV
jgi:hypothetical protein